MNCAKIKHGISVKLTDEEVIEFYKFTFANHSSSITSIMLENIKLCYRNHGIDLRRKVMDSITPEMKNKDGD
jgi:hypothetical protein